MLSFQCVIQDCINHCVLLGYAISMHAAIKIPSKTKWHLNPFITATINQF